MRTLHTGGIASNLVLLMRTGEVIKITVGLPGLKSGCYHLCALRLGEVISAPSLNMPGLGGLLEDEMRSLTHRGKCSVVPGENASVLMVEMMVSQGSGWRGRG